MASCGAVEVNERKTCSQVDAKWMVGWFMVNNRDWLLTDACLDDVCTKAK